MIDTGPRQRVLLVGRGAPEQGGIAVFLDSLLTGPLADEFDLDLLNLTRASDMGPPGGCTRKNLVRTIEDGWSVFRRAGQVDLVHVHSSLGGSVTTVRAGWLAWCARLRRRPVIVHAHGGRVISWLETGLARRIMWLSMRTVDEVIAVSQSVADALRPLVADGRVTFVSNGIDLTPFEAVPQVGPDTPPRVLYVGHLTGRKGLLDLRDAGRILRLRGVEHQITVAGGEPDEGPGERVIIENELRGEVEMLGRIDHASIPDVARTSSVFCLPSWWEATPLSVIEAMAAGRPVVATKVGDIPRMVVDGVTGVLVQVGHPGDLADALQSLLTDPDRCAEMGAAGRRRAAEQFDADDTQRQLAKRYRAVISRRRSPTVSRHDR